MLDKNLKKIKDKKTLAEYLRAKYFSFNKLINSTETLIKKKKLEGYNIFYLSNITSYGFKPYKDLEIWKFFDGGLVAGDESYQKPEPKIYRELEQKYNLNPEETIYIDDRKENLEPAKDLGWETILYDSELSNLDKEIAHINEEVYKIPKILFLGKPNVGKSSLFNAMALEEIQIVTDVAGTTLSVNETEIQRDSKSTYKYNFRSIKNYIFDLSGVILLTNGLNQEIFDYIFNLKKSENKVYYLTNQSELGMEEIKKSGVLDIFDGGVASFEIGSYKPNPEIFEHLIDKYQINPKTSFFLDDSRDNVEAARNLGFLAYTYELGMDVEELLKKANQELQEEFEIQEKKKYLLLDSAGIRRTSQRKLGAETFATYRTIQAAYEADVICLVVDGSEPITHQDQVVAGIAKEAAKGVVVVANKADQVSPEKRLDFVKEFETKFAFLKIKKFLWVSAKQAFERLSLDLDTQNLEEPKDLIFDFDSTWVLGISEDITKDLLTKDLKTQTEIKNFLESKNAKIYSQFLDQIKKLQTYKKIRIGLISNLEEDSVKKILDLYEIKVNVIKAKSNLNLTQKLLEINSEWQNSQFNLYYFSQDNLNFFELESILNKSKIIGCGWETKNLPALKSILPKKQILKKFIEIHKVFPKILTIDKPIWDLEQIWETIDEALAERNQEISRSQLRKIFNYLVKQKRPQKLRNKQKTVMYDLLFIKSSPPTFELLVKDKSTVHWSYIRFLENLLRRNFKFENTEIKVKLKEVSQKKVMSY